MYDTMQFISPPVSRFCTGQAASAGSLLAVRGAKDMRFTLPNPPSWSTSLPALPGPGH